MPDKNLEYLDTQVIATIKITKDNLPKGPFWDEDGACFRAELDNPVTTGCEWRWKPNNWKAFEKGKPDKELFPFVVSLRSNHGNRTKL